VDALAQGVLSTEGGTDPPEKATARYTRSASVVLHEALAPTPLPPQAW